MDIILDPKLAEEIKSFSDKVLPNIYELIAKYKAGKKVIIIKSRAEIDNYLNELIEREG